MYHRLILTALAITYLFCVLLLGGIKEDDLDKNTLSKLQRYNVNIEDLNNGTKYQECMAKLNVDNMNNITKNQETNSQNINKSGSHTEQDGNTLTILTRTEVIQDAGIIETTTPGRVTETVSNESNTENTDDMTKMLKLYNEFQIIQKKEVKKEKNTIKSAIEEILKHKPDKHKVNNKSKVMNVDTIEKVETERPVKVQEQQEQDSITSKPPKTTSEPGGTIFNSQLSNVKNFKYLWEMYSTFQDIEGTKDQINNPKTSDPSLQPKLTDDTKVDISGTSLRRNNENDSLMTSQVMDVLSKKLAQQYINERNKQTTNTPLMDDVMVQIKNFIDAKSRGAKRQANVLFLNESDTSSKTLALNSETLDYVRFIKPPDRDLVIDITNNNNRSRFVSNSTNPKKELEFTDRDVTSTIRTHNKQENEADLIPKPKQNRITMINKSRGTTNTEGSNISLLPQETLQEIINQVKNKIIRDLKEEIFNVTPVSTTKSTTMTTTTKTTTTTTTERPKLEEFSEAKILFENFSNLFEKIKKITTGSSNKATKYDNVTKKHIIPETTTSLYYENNSVKQNNFIQTENDIGPIPRANAVVSYPVPTNYINSQSSFDPYQMGNEKIEIPPPSFNIQQSKNPYGFSNPQSPAIKNMQQSLKIPLQSGITNYPTPYLVSFNQRAKPAYDVVVQPKPVAQQRNSFLTMNLQPQSRSHFGTLPIGYPNQLRNAPRLSQNDGFKQPQTNTLKSYTNSIANSNGYLKMIEQPQPEHSKQVAITIQTNSGEIQPLGIPITLDTGKSLSRLLQNQNIIVTTERPRGSRPKIPDIPIGIEERYDEYKYLGPRVRSHTHEEVKPKVNTRHRSRPPFTHQDLEEFSVNKESYTPSYIDRSYTPSHRERSHTPSYRDNSYEYTFSHTVRSYTPSYRDKSDEYSPTHRSRPNYRHNPDRYYRNENEELRTPQVQSKVSTEVDQRRIKKHYTSRYEQREQPRHRETPYRDRVAHSAEEAMSRPSRVSTREQMPLKAKPKYDDSHFKNFIQTQQKVNAMLENILSKSSKPKSYREDIFSN